MISLLRNLLQWSLPSDRVCEPAHVEHRRQTLCCGDFIGTELSFEADEFGLHVRRETMEARARRLGAA